MAEATGRCLCGAVRYAFDEAQVLWRGYCHCESCRRATGAPVSAYFGVAEGFWRWTGTCEARVFRSSPDVERRFCRRCGSPVSYSSRRFPGEMHFHVSTLDDPSSFQPEFHVFWRERLGWFRLDDDLLRFPGASPGGTD